MAKSSRPARSASVVHTKARCASRSWPPLQTGDIVDVIAPGSSCKIENLKKGVEILQSWGLTPRVHDPIFARDVICSNTDEERFRQLKVALTSKDSRAVWCVRGGYGSNRLVPELAKLKRPNFPPKLFIGYSDITTLHLFLNEKWKWPSLHGPMVDRMGRGLLRPEDLSELRDILFGRQTEVVYPGLQPLNEAAKKVKSIRAPVTGGNVMTLQSSIGTKASWMTAGHIIFLEEVDERGYRLDRMLAHLEQTGHFAKAKAIVLGDFIGGEEADGTSRVWPVIERFAQGLKIPVLKNIPAGHSDLQKPIPLATMALLRTGENGQLTISTGVALETSARSKKARA